MLSQAMKIVKSVLVFTYSCCLGMTIQPPMHVLGDVWHLKPTFFSVLEHKPIVCSVFLLNAVFASVGILTNFVSHMPLSDLIYHEMTTSNVT